MSASSTTPASPKPRRAERCARACLLLAFAAGGAPAHEGHDHATPAAPVAAAQAPRLSYRSPRLESVAYAEGGRLLVYVDDYASNRPLAGLDVRLRSGTRSLQASEPEPGLYVATPEAAPGPLPLQVSLRGSGWEEHYGGTLEWAAPAPAGADGWVAPLLLLLLLGLAACAAAGIAVARRRR